MSVGEKNTELFYKEDQIQLLTFVLDRDVFGAQIGQVQEVLEYTKVSRVPRAPDYMMGVINLRGNVVPVLDLRKQFEMSQAEITVESCIVIVEVEIDSEQTALGLLADAVKEVLVLEGDAVSPPPKIGTSIDTRYIMGMGKYDDEFIIILDLKKVFTHDEVDRIRDAGQSKPTGGELEHRESIVD